jgi:hypothetical protein
LGKIGDKQPMAKNLGRPTNELVNNPG